MCVSLCVECYNCSSSVYVFISVCFILSWVVHVYNCTLMSVCMKSENVRAFCVFLNKYAFVCVCICETCIFSVLWLCTFVCLAMYLCGNTCVRVHNCMFLLVYMCMVLCMWGDNCPSIVCV